MDSENKKFVVAAWFFVGCMIVAIIAISLYIAPASQPGPAVSAIANVDDDPRISMLVSTRVLTEDEIAETRRHQDSGETVKQPHYEDEIIVTAVIQNEIHLVAATPTPQAGEVNPVETTETLSGDIHSVATAQHSGMPPVSESQVFSPLPTPASPIPTPISPLATPELPTPQDAADIQEFVQTVVDSQNDYYAVHGEYAQIIFGNEPVCPGDCISIEYPEGVSVAVHVYDSPSGDGYEIVIIDNGWQIIVNHGPESSRSTGWRRYEP